jgi:hypothetical protein
MGRGAGSREHGAWSREHGERALKNDPVNHFSEQTDSAVGAWSTEHGTPKEGASGKNDPVNHFSEQTDSAEGA